MTKFSSTNSKCNIIIKNIIYKIDKCNKIEAVMLLFAFVLVAVLVMTDLIILNL